VLIFAVFMIIYGWQLMKAARTNSMAGINIPYKWMYASLPVTGVLYLFGLVSQWVRRLDQR
jgi:TRAP-type C4-dicarboxylate transport system permease small subunit